MPDFSRLSHTRIRPIKGKDLQAFAAFAEMAGEGMTTIPRDETALIAKIERSERSFSGQARGKDAEYFMVMEDRSDDRLIGCAAVYPEIGMEFGFYSFRRLREHRRSKEFDIVAESDTLHLTNEFTGCTEVGSLILHPDWRGTGAGRMLAQSRYLLMAQFPDLFADTVIAEMRGSQGPEGGSPFWDAVGRRFFGLNFAEADRISAVHGNEFIADLMPRYPIYLPLLGQEIVDLVGVPHADSAPAMRMLLREGFVFDGFIDVFDAGPQVIARRANIATVRASRLLTHAQRDKPRERAGAWLFATTCLSDFEVHFRADVADDALWNEDQPLRAVPF
ncbi:MAG: arginine N-succinyltransferase [Pseudomonadota bacterium]